MVRDYRTFEELEVYIMDREYRKKIYNLTKKLPHEEKYNLNIQMRKAATSLTNNVAEGHGRYHYQDNIRFCRQSRGSLEEILDDLNICIDEKYFKENFLEQLKKEGYQLLKKLNGYIKYLKSCKEVSVTL